MFLVCVWAVGAGETEERFPASLTMTEGILSGRDRSAVDLSGEERPGFQKRLGTTARCASPIAQTSAVRSSLRRNLRCGPSRRLQQGRQFVARRFRRSYSLPPESAVQVEHHNIGTQDTKRTGVALIFR